MPNPKEDTPVYRIKFEIYNEETDEVVVSGGTFMDEGTMKSYEHLALSIMEYENAEDEFFRMMRQFTSYKSKEKKRIEDELSTNTNDDD